MIPISANVIFIDFHTNKFASSIMNIIKILLNIISLLLYSVSLYYLFEKVPSIHGNVYHHAYGTSLCWFLTAFVLGMVSNTTFSKINVGIYVFTLFMVTLFFMYDNFWGNPHKNSFDLFFNSLMLGFCAWFISACLPIWFDRVSTKNKTIVILGILAIGTLSYILLRSLPAVWHILRSESGAHFIWLILGKLAMLGCTIFIIKPKKMA